MCPSQHIRLSCPKSIFRTWIYWGETMSKPCQHSRQTLATRQDTSGEEKCTHEVGDLKAGWQGQANHFSRTTHLVGCHILKNPRCTSQRSSTMRLSTGSLSWKSLLHQIHVPHAYYHQISRRPPLVLSLPKPPPPDQLTAERSAWESGSPRSSGQAVLHSYLPTVTTDPCTSEHIMAHRTGAVESATLSKPERPALPH